MISARHRAERRHPLFRRRHPPLASLAGAPAPGRTRTGASGRSHAATAQAAARRGPPPAGSRRRPAPSASQDAFVRDERGAALIESMLAIAILGLSLAALMHAFGALGLAAGHLDRATAADAVAHSVAESVLDQPYSATGSYSPTLNAANPRGYAVTLTVEFATDPAAVAPATPPTFVAAPATDYGLQRITVRVTPTQGGSARTTRVLKRQ